MGKILGSWSGMRKYLEQEMIANSLRGRVRYSCTTFVGMDGCGIFEIIVDNKTVKQFSMETVASDLFNESQPIDVNKYWEAFWKEKEETQIENRNEFGDMEFAEALCIYRKLNINESIISPNPIVRMFAVLDRRVGKRTLEKIKHDIQNQPKWLRYFYRLRLDSENIKGIVVKS